jgi:class 3 adenylate cyclase/predicted ATPase
MDRADEFYQQGRIAFDQRAWLRAIRDAARALAAEPTHAGALNLIVAARQQLDLSADPEGERRVLSVLMADLVGSTRLPGILGPEGYREVLLALHAIAVTAITAYEGRVAQYLGDGVLAFFSYPEAHEDDARRAVLAGLDIVNGVEARQEGFRARFGVEIGVRIGIDTGLVLVGSLGAGRWTTSDSIVGDPPNVASRIQHLAQPNTVLVSEATRRLVDRHVVFRAGRPRKVRGFAAPVVLHRALGPISTSPSIPLTVRAIVGRESETQALARMWSAVLKGDRRMITLVGEAGVGKSRLVDHVVNLAHASGARSVVLNCLSLRRHVPFHPVVAALREYLAIDPATASELSMERLRESVSDLILPGIDAEHGLSVLASVLGVGTPDDLLPEQVRERTLSALAGLVSMLCEDGPVLLVVEDMHDADPSSIELLLRVISQSDAVFGLVLTSRPGGPVLPESVETTTVTPLSSDQAAAVVRRVLPDATSEQVDRLVARADGIPLYLEELGRWTAEQPDRSTVPVALSGVLSARLDGLPSGAREVASAAAVIGNVVDYELLAAVSKLPGDRLDRQLAALVDRQVLVRMPNPVNMAYQFRHALLREAAYGRQVRDVRRRAHRRCARMLADRADRSGGEASSVVAAHFEEGAERAEALRWWSRAAREAAAQGAHREAIEQFERALALEDVLPEGDERRLNELGLRIGLGLSSSVVAGYSSPTALEAFEQADRIGAALPASSEWAAAIWGIWSFLIVRGELGRAGVQVDRAREMARVMDDPELADTTAAMAGYVLFFEGRLDEALTELSQGAGSRATLLPNDPRAVSTALIGVIHWMQGDLEASERVFADAFDQAEEIPGGRGAFTLAFISAYRAWLAQLGGDAGVAIARAQSTIALAAEHGFMTWQAAGYLHLTIGMCHSGSLEPGLAQLEATIQAWRAAGAGLMLPYFLGQLAAAKLAAGSSGQAHEIVQEAILLGEQHGEHIYDAELFRIRALVREALGAPSDEVVDDLRQAVRIAVRQGARIFALRGLKELARFRVFDVRCDDSVLRLDTAVGWWADGTGPPELAAVARPAAL